MNKIFVLTACILLSSCAFLGTQPEPLPPVKIVTRPVQIDVYQPKMPPPIQLDEVRWFVITEENLEEKIEEIKEFNGEFVIFAITPSTYENMAYNFQEVRRYMLQQKEVILYYRDATQSPNRTNWLEENEQWQNLQLEAIAGSSESNPATPENDRNWIQKLFRFGD